MRIERFLSSFWRTTLAVVALVWAILIWPTLYRTTYFHKSKGEDLFLRQNRLTGEHSYFDFSTGVWQGWSAKPSGEYKKGEISPESLTDQNGKPLEIEDRYVRIFNQVIGDKFFFSTFNENEGKGRCHLFLEQDGEYTGQYWDLRNKGSMRNQFLGNQREVYMGKDGGLFMAVSGSTEPSVRFYEGSRSGVFKITINEKFLSANKNRRHPNGLCKIFASDMDLGEASDWIFVNSEKGLPGRKVTSKPRPPAKDLIDGPLNGRWVGRLPKDGGNLKLVFNIETLPQGLRATMDSPDQNAFRIPVNLISLKERAVFLRIDDLDVAFEGSFDVSQKKIIGIFTQYKKVLDLELSFSPQDKVETGDVQEGDKTSAILVRANKGDADAQSLLGHIYRGDYGDPQNLEQSLRWFKAAALQGDTVGENGYGWALENGLAVTANPQEAVTWYRRAAKKDDLWALNRLGRCYLYGVGVPENPDEAQAFYAKASQIKILRARGPLPTVKNSRNPFSIPDIPDFDLKKIKSFAEKLSWSSPEKDPNAQKWAESDGRSEKMPSVSGLEGAWSSRWNGGSRGPDWLEGKAEIKEKDGKIYILYRDSSDTYLIEAQKEGATLFGKYRDQAGSDQGPWVGRLIDQCRIDGQWSQGRWDFRR